MENCVISTEIFIQQILQNSVFSHLANQKDLFFLINLQASRIGQFTESKASDFLIVASKDE